VALHRGGDELDYPDEVTWQIHQDQPGDYLAGAASLGPAGVRVASIQHEYGIFGGPAGEYVLGFLDGLDVPAVTTLHTVLSQPTDAQRAVLTRVVGRSAAIVVMSLAAARLVRQEYGGADARIEVIHHGVPDLPMLDPESGKAALGFEGRTVILSFGLLGPGKGYEHMIDAMERLRSRHPEALFVILGATHPDLLRIEGEAYRNALLARVEARGLGRHVRFIDRYLAQEEVIRFLLAADIYVTPYPNLDQIVSGTLSWAVGAGKAVISTPYAYARELLADGRGVLVEPRSGEALAAGLDPLLADRTLREDLGRRAWNFGRRMVWEQVGAAYRRLFDEIGDVQADPRHPVLATRASRRPLVVHG
jgi:glycosyltransferase involved in cell wall biosynthesis